MLNESFRKVVVTLMSHLLYLYKANITFMGQVNCVEKMVEEKKIE